MVEMNYYGVVPEWAPQDAVIVAWPHKATDWNSILNEAHQQFATLIEAIAQFEPVIVLTANGETPERFLTEDTMQQVSFIDVPFNDTWVRDYGPLCYTLNGSDSKRAVYYTFNGWGLKFAAHLDNMVTPYLFRQVPLFNTSVQQAPYRKYQLEGGGFECNGAGIVLYNKYWLNAPNRNEGSKPEEIEATIKESLGVELLLEVDVPPLVGDDTDGHIDTLVRFIDTNTLVYVSPSDASSPNFVALRKLEEQLKGLRNQKGEPFHLIALPDVGLMCDADGEVLPASYANFLFVNGGVIVPTYGVPKHDVEAIAAFQEIFYNRKVVTAPANILVKWHGSIHCATMQIAKGFLLS